MADHVKSSNREAEIIIVGRWGVEELWSSKQNCGVPTYKGGVWNYNIWFWWDDLHLLQMNQPLPFLVTQHIFSPTARVSFSLGKLILFDRTKLSWNSEIIEDHQWNTSGQSNWSKSTQITQFWASIGTPLNGTIVIISAHFSTQTLGCHTGWPGWCDGGRSRIGFWALSSEIVKQEQWQ